MKSDNLFNTIVRRRDVTDTPEKTVTAFICAWCKGDKGVYSWIANGEPICSDECLDKYQFAKSKGLITGRVSDLSAAQRRQISERLHVLRRFRSVARSIGREELRGGYKKIKAIGTITIFLLVFGLQGLIAYKTGVLGGEESSDTTSFLFIGAGVIVWYLQKCLAWFLRFKQIKRDANVQ